MGHYGSFWFILAHYGSFWLILCFKTTGKIPSWSQPLQEIPIDVSTVFQFSKNVIRFTTFPEMPNISETYLSTSGEQDNKLILYNLSIGSNNHPMCLSWGSFSIWIYRSILILGTPWVLFYKAITFKVSLWKYTC